MSSFTELLLLELHTLLDYRNNLYTLNVMSTHNSVTIAFNIEGIIGDFKMK